MKRLAVGIPTSILSVEPSLLLRTLRAYQIIRYSSIFGVDEIVLYYDGFTSFKKHEVFARFIRKLWKYLIMPPYLRRKLVPLQKELRYVGVLPPLRLEVFDVSQKGVMGEKRLGYIYMHRGVLYADIGLGKPFKVVNQCDVGKVCLVEIIDLENRIVKCISEHENYYLGPSLTVMNSLRQLLNTYINRGYLVIATSRYGRTPPISEARSLVRRNDKILVIFGGPKHGLYDIAEREGFKLEDTVKYIWNTMPGQKVKTVRSEEALIATLALVNMFMYG